MFVVREDGVALFGGRGSQVEHEGCLRGAFRGAGVGLR